MTRRRCFSLTLTAIGMSATMCTVRLAHAQQIHLHTGTCDASAVVLVGDDRFLMASDEDNRLRLYSADEPSGPLDTFDFTSFLEVDEEHPEADIEAATTLGNWTVWITSHGRSKNGKRRESRRRMFATTVIRDGERITLRPVGKPYKRLLDDLLAAPQLKEFRLDEAEGRAPTESQAINIEGLAAGPDAQLWLAFRNPVPQGRALLVPLENPGNVLERSEPASLGRAVLVDLGGLGVRGLEYSPMHQKFLLLAGDSTDGSHFALYAWSGKESEAPSRFPIRFDPGLSPEAIALRPNASGLRLLLLSDDGDRKIDGASCKDLADPLRQSFRSWTLAVD